MAKKSEAKVDLNKVRAPLGHEVITYDQSTKKNPYKSKFDQGKFGPLTEQVKKGMQSLDPDGVHLYR